MFYGEGSDAQQKAATRARLPEGRTVIISEVYGLTPDESNPAAPSFLDQEGIGSYSTVPFIV
eukprot:COSAG02_NODE_5426_length_4341_cov_9.347949_2_plen_62_part_00